MNIAIFLSGRGSNFVSIAEAIKKGELDAKIVLVASNRPDANGLKTARAMGLPTAVFNRSEFDDGGSFADFMLEKLEEHNADYIVLAGYLRLMPPRVVRAYRNKIVNIHPALLPKFGGKGMYGMNVHRSVLESGEKETGVTVHYVNEKYDQGEIIAQERVVVKPDDTVEKLARRVLEVEHRFYPEILQKISQESYK